MGKYCPDCRGTGKIELLTSTVDCKCTQEECDGTDYADAVLEVDLKWLDGCCSCHISPPCGFCTRYADANLDEPEYCDRCGEPSPQEKALLSRCSKCYQMVCGLCYNCQEIICVNCKKKLNDGK